MKNKIIISLIFIVPLIIYFVLLAVNPEINLEEAVDAKTNLPKVLIFSTPMCGECHKMIPIIEDSKTKYDNRIEFIKINANDSKHEHLVRKYMIYLVPTILYMDKDGKVIQRTEGAMSAEEFDGFVNKLVKE